MIKKERIIKRNERIKRDYWKLHDKKKYGVRIYTDDYIFARLAEKYALAPSTIEQIVFERIRYKWQK